MMLRFNTVLLIVILSSIVIGCKTATNSKVLNTEKKPNFIIVLVDDMGWGDVGYQGADDMLTPNIDKLASEGTQFSQGYVTCSVCGPSRTSLLSGRYSDEIGIWGNFGKNAKDGFPADEKMISDYVKQAGYTTGAIGKWHMGYAKDEFKPENRNWDYFYGFYIGGHDYFNAAKSYDHKKANEWPIQRNSDIVDYNKGDYLTDKFNEEAVDFIDKNSDKPFLLYVAYNAVHYPWSVPDNYLERVDKERDIKLKYRRILAGMTLAIDDGVGAMMNKLKEKNIDDNTVIIFLSDNGSPKGIAGHYKHNYGETAMSSTGGLKGFKGDTYEGGIRVPFIMKWPGKTTPGQVYDKPVISIDILPTIAENIGVSTKEDHLSGVNLLPYIQGTKKERPHEVLYWTYQDDYAIRDGDWKLTWNDQELNENMLTIKEHGEKVPGAPKSVETRLFNLAEDPYEKHNLKDKYPEIAKRLQEKYNTWGAAMPLNGKPLFKQPYTRTKKFTNKQ
ncbi:sulfatase-like hydrolase/transferase [Tamlana sp. 2201CG12-4]|uniref:sulfatase family protein n=1 Tax=Tamlana sp. 2201CG12-4 TaxID=3112582 RepID=UPI002DB91F85|nr:sulfatase-like hydrolase/transferase [Tamlana sp. 2201CG12-4]MEC3905715.1 sulfatase-like hydrolase/transferase [Tamlana sp. 2201CG12-4]